MFRKLCAHQILANSRLLCAGNSVKNFDVPLQPKCSTRELLQRKETAKGPSGTDPKFLEASRNFRVTSGNFQKNSGIFQRVSECAQIILESLGRCIKYLLRSVSWVINSLKFQYSNKEQISRNSKTTNNENGLRKQNAPLHTIPTF